MGNSSSRVGLMSEPPKKHGFFSIMKSKSNKNQDFKRDFCQNKKQPHVWSGSSNERTKKSEARNTHASKCEEKFRTRFDPRITARYFLYYTVKSSNFVPEPNHMTIAFEQS